MSPKTPDHTTRNPFDFANPVQEMDLLIGRDREERDVRYYLEQAQKVSHPTNVALIGERASGKTSMLNLIQKISADLEMCPVRIDLNVGDVTGQLHFWFKIFDALFTTIIDCRRADTPEDYCFCGRGGETFDAYLDMLSTFTVPEEKEFCPFIFPIIYAKAMASEQDKGPVSDTLLKRDLVKLQRGE